MGDSSPFGAAARHLPAERADLALEVPDAGLARVAADHLPQRAGVKRMYSAVRPWFFTCLSTR